MKKEEKAKACHVKCDEGAYFAVGKREERREEKDFHKLCEKPGEIASLRSQNPYTYYA